MKQLLSGFCSLLLVSILFTACRKDNDLINNPNSSQITYNLQLSGNKVDPPNASGETGIFTATYYKATRTLSYTLSFTGPTPTGWHIHKTDITSPGPIIFDLGTTTSSTTSGTLVLSERQEAELVSGLYYVDIHTTAYPGGEVRAVLPLQE